MEVEFHQDVHITLGPEAIGQNRPEKRELANVVALAKAFDQVLSHLVWAMSA